MEENKAEFGTIQYIVVKIGSEQYGIDIKYVDNIVRMQKITRVPKIQSYFKGVINLRGEIVPVMSLRLKMSQPETELTGAARIIIVKLEPQSAIGIIVDEVREVVTLEGDEIEKVSYDAKDDRGRYVLSTKERQEAIAKQMEIDKKG